MIGLLVALTTFASGTIHRCGLDNLPVGWVSGTPLPRSSAQGSNGAGRVLSAPNSLVTDHFILWWTMTGVHQIRDGGRTIAAGDSVPGLVRAAATGLEKAWHLYVDTLGYLPPTPYFAGAFEGWGDVPPRGKYPVEILSIANNGTLDVKPGDEYFGLTYSLNGPASAMELGADIPTFGQWSYRKDLDGQAIREDYATDWNVVMQSTAAHELFHAVQYNYEYKLNHFLFEASAVAMEKAVVPKASDYLVFSDAAYGGLCGVSNLTPMFSAIQAQAYPHAWYVKQLVADFGEDMLKSLWEHRANAPQRSIENTLRDVIESQTTVSLDTTLARYALRLGLTGRRSNWLQSVSPAFSPFSDAALFETLDGTLAPPASPQTIPLQAGQMQEWIDTTGSSADRIVDWIPDAGAQLGHAWKGAPGSGMEWLRGSVRLPANTTRQDVWSLSNPGPLTALRNLATTKSARPLLWTSTAPGRTNIYAGQKLAWTDGGAILSGVADRDDSCTPLLHTDVWIPVASEDPFAASITGRSGGHAFVLEDADRVLSLRGATISLPYTGLGTVWTGSGDGVWRPASASVSGGTTVVTLGNLDLSVPVRILAAPGAAPQGLVTRPFPNPSRDGAPIHFPISGAAAGASLEILSADGTAIRRLEADPGRTEIVWDVKNASGSGVKPGVYWYVWRAVTGAKRGELLIAK